MPTGMKPITELNLKYPFDETSEGTSRNYTLLHANYNWCLDIFKRVDEVLKAEYYTPQEKIDGITWLIKQGLKAESEE
jgi:hypothetical protein